MRVRARSLTTSKRWGVERPIIVYQMGHVASVAVYETLRSLNLGVGVYHKHRLREDVLDNPELLWQRQLRRHLDDPHAGPPWHIVTLVRDPVERNLSSFFHNLGKRTYPAYRPEFEGGIDLTNEELLEHYLSHADYEIDFARGWFDDEIGHLFGIDVFSEPFPHDAGFCIITGDRARVLVLRTEDLTQRLHAAIEAFLDIPGVQPRSANRNTSGIYRRFLEQVAVPETYVDRVYSSRLARHFYTPDELASFKVRWTRTGR